LSQYYSKTDFDDMGMLQKEDNDWVKKCMEYEVEVSRPRGLGERCKDC